MKPETAEFLRKAREFLPKAREMLAHWPDEAGRAAYFAGFHAAQAFIFEYRGSSAKTHSGVQTEFARLVKSDSRIDAELRAFLGRAYNLKSAADYETGPGAVVTPARAGAAVETAARFVDRISNLLSASDAKPSGDTDARS